NNLHVSGLSHAVDTRDLEAAFAKVGRVKKASVMYDPHTRESRGFGFVTMESPDEAEAAVVQLTGMQIRGRVIAVQKVGFFVSLLFNSANFAFAGPAWSCTYPDSWSVPWAAEEGRR
ncbi:hypothetical protein B0H16DRAFT_1345006, partial [Mycena metata]